MTTVVVSPANVANYPEGGGHSWVYLQYVHALRQLGCDVYWLERFRRTGDRARDDAALRTFSDRMRRFGISGRVILYAEGAEADGDVGHEYVGIPRLKAERLLRNADLLLNFQYAIAPAVLQLFRRTALVDIDPGLLQFWIATGQLTVPPHDAYFTTGETVGKPSALFSDCGVDWIPIHPPVCLDLWPRVSTEPAPSFSTVSSWWGGGAKGHAEWIVDGADVCYDNCKRVSFLEFLELPRLTRSSLELALNLSDDEEDVAERQLLERVGWRVRHSREVAGSPEAYQAYVQGSRGEFSCAKPSCMRFQNAWVSDRTICYLASGRPVVVQHTGPSSFLPNGEGMFRFATLAEAVDALAAVESAYERHCRAARELAEAYFDAERVIGGMLEAAFADAGRDKEDACVRI
jgi:hypothetical protein